MKFKDNLPIYIQIMRYIKKDIVTAKLKAGEKLPSVREYSTILTVNPNTIQRAYTELEREGFVFTQRGMGTFVTEDMDKIKSLTKDMAKNLVSSFLKEMFSLNFNKDEIKNFIDLYAKED